MQSKIKPKMKSGIADQLTKKHPRDAGLDIRSAEKTKVYPFKRKLISTDLYVDIPEGFVGEVWARSGLAVKHGVIVGAGVVDSGYTGELKVLLFNMSDEVLEIEKGDRIAQLITKPIYTGEYEKVTIIDEAERGDKGFGSSGTK